MKKNPRWTFITIAIIMVCMLMTSIGQASPTTIGIDPSEVKDLDPGQSFSVNITVTDVTDLYSWSVNLTFDPAVLNVENVTEGPFLKQAHNTVPLPVNIDNAAGFVFAGAIFMIPLPENGSTGSGVLATIVFTVKGSGATDLHFELHKLHTVISTNQILITHTATDGVFRNVARTIVSIEVIIAIIAIVAIVGGIIVVLYRKRTAET